MDTDSPDNKREDKLDDDTTNRRENLRAKLRQSEARLLKFTRSEDATGGIIGHMAAVTADLKKIEEERSMLEVELGQLQNKTDDQNDEFLKKQMAGIQEGFKKQVEMITGLQEELAIKEDEIAQLREDLVKKLRRIVELEFDLETHSVHYTNYAKEQFKLSEEALAEINSSILQSADVEVTEAASPSTLDGDVSFRSVGTRHGSQRKAEKLITKLLGDLDDLEARYKVDRLDSASEIHKSQMTIDQLTTRIEVLEQELASSRKSSDDAENSNDFDRSTEQKPPLHSSDAGEESMTVQVLRRRNQALEARRVLSQREIERLSAALSAHHASTNELTLQHQNTIDELKMDNSTLRARLNEMENSSTRQNQRGGGGILKKMTSRSKSLASASVVPQHPSGELYASIQKRLQQYVGKLALLEAEQSVKNRQISTLKQEVASLRMREIAVGNNVAYSEDDSNLLKSQVGRGRMRRDGSTECSDEGGKSEDDSYICELQMQLQEANHLLVKKDQELVIERARSASTAAGLLARITAPSSLKN